MLPHVDTLKQLEESLGGPIPVVEGSATIPSRLREIGEAHFKGNCELSWWTVVSVCHSGHAGYLHTDHSGTMHAECPGDDTWTGTASGTDRVEAQLETLWE